MEKTISTRGDFYTFDNGEKPPLQFSQTEYDSRLKGLLKIMSDKGLEAVVLTSMHCVSYYTGFTYCSFGRPYACVVTHDRAFTISAGIDGGMPARRSATENIIYSDWKRDNVWRAVKSYLGNAKALGIERDHLTIIQQSKIGLHSVIENEPIIRYVG